jgi:hypothetical protein
VSFKENQSGASLFLRDGRGGSRMVGVFRGSRTSAPGDAWWKATQESLELAESFMADAGKVRGDPMLSDAGKKSAVRERAIERLATLKAHAQRTHVVHQLVREKLAPLSPMIPLADTVGQLERLFLAQMYRESAGTEREVLARQIGAGTNRKLQQAVLAHPELSGASENLLRLAADKAVEQLHPVELERREEIEAQSRTTRKALDESLWSIAEEAGLTANELREALGQDSEHFSRLIRMGPDPRPRDPPAPDTTQAQQRASLDSQLSDAVNQGLSTGAAA